MFVVRNIFHAKPGKADELAGKFKSAMPIFESEFGDSAKFRVLTDVVAGFWTVVIESQVEDLSAYLSQSQAVSKNERLAQAMAGYKDLVDSGHREIFKLH